MGCEVEWSALYADLEEYAPSADHLQTMVSSVPFSWLVSLRGTYRRSLHPYGCTAYQYNLVSGHYGSGDITGRPSGCRARQNIDLMLNGGRNRTPAGASSLVLVTGERPDVVPVRSLADCSLVGDGLAAQLQVADTESHLDNDGSLKSTLARLETDRAT
jgi:hypothetical protein